MVNRMQRVFATKVSVLGNDNKGRIYIDYYKPRRIWTELLNILNGRRRKISIFLAVFGEKQTNNIEKPINPVK